MTERGEEVAVKGGGNVASNCGDGFRVRDVWQLDDEVWRKWCGVWGRGGEWCGDYEGFGGPVEWDIGGRELRCGATRYDAPICKEEEGTACDVIMAHADTNFSLRFDGG